VHQPGTQEAAQWQKSTDRDLTLVDKFSAECWGWLTSWLKSLVPKLSYAEPGPSHRHFKQGCWLNSQALHSPAATREMLLPPPSQDLLAETKQICNLCQVFPLNKRQKKIISDNHMAYMGLCLLS